MLSTPPKINLLYHLCKRTNNHVLPPLNGNKSSAENKRTHYSATTMLFGDDHVFPQLSTSTHEHVKTNHQDMRPDNLEHNYSALRGICLLSKKHVLLASPHDFDN